METENPKHDSQTSGLADSTVPTTRNETTFEFFTANPLSLAELFERVAASPSRFFAVVDACDEASVVPKVSELGGERAVSLYKGWAEREHAAIAPYLIDLDQEVL